jgi:hypothetical protein
MYPFYNSTKPFLFIFTMLLSASTGLSQSCTPQGDQTTYGANNIWTAYLYQGQNFNTYKGYVNKGAAASPAFDESFGGNQVNYTTNGCTVYTEEFSVRFKLTKTFNNANYRFTVGGDDGYRLSLDGGATWVINRWNDQSYGTTDYTVHLNGAYNMVIEFYERYGNNRISFSVVELCTGNGNPAAYGANKTWSGYLYQGNNFDYYQGHITRGNGSSLNFDENFGTSNGAFATSNCSINTEYFSARFRSRTTLTGSYTFTVGGDDGYRLSLDGGATWIINRWQAQSYVTTTQTVSNLNGTYDMVLEFYENSGDNRLSFSATQLLLLPVTILDWSAKVINNKDVLLSWKTADAVNFDHFTVQKSTDAQQFRNMVQIAAKTGGATQSYTWTEQQVNAGKAWYRLAMTDKDGSVRYSSIVAVSLQQADAVRIYPTIVENKQVYIESNRKLNRVLVELVDMNGRVLQSEQRALPAGRQALPLTTFRAGSVTGAYIVRITGEEGLLAKQSVIIR